MQGKRHDMTEDDRSMGPGEYGKNYFDGEWYCNPPDTDLFGCLANHDVTEHEDGTITVSPSILITYSEGGQEVEQWHGYLERGIWRQV